MVYVPWVRKETAALCLRSAILVYNLDGYFFYNNAK
jgi:hypothetical protein